MMNIARANAPGHRLVIERIDGTVIEARGSDPGPGGVAALALDGVVMRFNLSGNPYLSSITIDRAVVDPLALRHVGGIDIATLTSAVGGDGLVVTIEPVLARVAVMAGLHDIPHPVDRRVWSLLLRLTVDDLAWLGSDLLASYADFEQEALSVIEDWLGGRVPLPSTVAASLFGAIARQLVDAIEEESVWFDRACVLSDRLVGFDDVDAWRAQEPVRMGSEGFDGSHPLLWHWLPAAVVRPGDWFATALEVEQSGRSFRFAVDVSDETDLEHGVLFTRVVDMADGAVRWAVPLLVNDDNTMFEGIYEIDLTSVAPGDVRFEVTTSLSAPVLDQTAWHRALGRQWFHVGWQEARRGRGSLRTASDYYRQAAATFGDLDRRCRVECERYAADPSLENASWLIDEIS